MTRGRRELPNDYPALHARYMTGGESVEALAAEAGITIAGLYRAFHRHGLPVRGFREAGRLLFESDPSRARLIEYATAKRRGMKDTMETREARARTREARGIGISDHERTLAAVLRGLGHEIRPQAACGPYNIDLLVDGWLAVDVHGGGHNGRQRANLAGRIQNIEAQGFRHVAVWARPTVNPRWLEVAMRKVTRELK